jgi:hypothetical protein
MILSTKDRDFNLHVDSRITGHRIESITLNAGDVAALMKLDPAGLALWLVDLATLFPASALAKSDLEDLLS